MHAVVPKRELVRILSRCQGVADRKSTMPVLGNVLVEASSDHSLRVSATDLYLSVSGRVRAEVEKEGSVAIGAKDLFERVKMMPEGSISLSVQGDGAVTLRARGQARRYTLKGLPGSEFPKLPAPATDTPELSLPVSTLAQLIAKTHFSIAADDTRPHLNSALLQWEGETVRMVTTDGHRLSKMEVALPGSVSETSMLIPLKGIQELKKLCDEAKAESVSDLALLRSGTTAFFRMPDYQLSVKLVEVQFPPYQQVIPASTQHRVSAPRALLADSLRAVSVAASDRTSGVKLTFGPNVIRFSSETPDSGDGFDEVAVEYEGDEVTVGFNATYLLHVLAATDAEDIVLGISGELDPATVEPGQQPDGEQFLAVIMPMRI